jgi:hypothetical protein
MGLGFAVFAAGASAQTMKSVAGAYTIAKTAAYGDKPQGQLILTPEGRYTLVLMRGDLKPVAAGARTKGTPEENKMVVDGSIMHFGSYTIDDGGKSITFNVEGSSFPNWNGKPQKRPLKVSGDMLTYAVAAPSAGKKPGEVAWRRIK